MTDSLAYRILPYLMALHNNDLLDLAYAMQRAVEQHAAPRTLSRVGPRMYFNGWWREGKNPNCLVNVGNATWHDFKTGEGGGCKHFAQTAFGLGLRDFLDRFGRLDPSQPRIPPPPEPPPRDGIPAFWDQLKARAAASAAWVRRRGVPPDEVVSGFADLSAGAFRHEPYMEGWVQRFVRANGQAIVVPMRSMATGAVENLHFRSLIPGRERRFMPRGRLTWQDDVRLYGMADKALDAGLTVVTEGAFDTMALEAMLRPLSEVCVVGVAGTGLYTALARALFRKRRGSVMFVPQVDDAGLLATAKAAALLEEGQVPYRMFDWDRLLERLDVPQCKDVGDVVKARAFGDCRKAFIQLVCA